MAEDAKKVGLRIRELRRQKGFNSAEELAEKARIPTSTLYRIESGDKEATVRELTSISEALGIEFIELFFADSQTAATASTVEEESTSYDANFIKFINQLNSSTAKQLPLDFAPAFRTSPIDSISAALKKYMEDPVVNEHYRYLKRIAQTASGEFRIGRMGQMYMRFSLRDDNLETFVQIMSLLLAYDEKWKTPDDEEQF